MRSWARAGLVAVLLVAGCAAPTAAPSPVPSADPSTPTPGADLMSPSMAITPVPTRAQPSEALAASPTVAARPTQIPGTPRDATIIRSAAARVAASEADAERAAKAIDSFAAELYAELAKEMGGNLVFSPYSAVAALAMTRTGAAGETAAQMDAVLRLDGSRQGGIAMNALEQALADRTTLQYGDPKLAPELGTANQLWGQRGFSFEQPFLDTLAAYYGAGMYLVDYVDAGARERARADINGWVAERTRDRIKELIPRDVLDELTRIVLTNAIYLKAKWQREFHKTETAAAPFRRLDGTVSQVRMMSTGGSFGYGSGPGYQAVQLGYFGELSMVAIVPDAGTFAAFEKGLRELGRLRSIVDGLRHDHYVALRFPRFEFRTAADLETALTALGMPLAFDPERADFSAMSRERLYLQAALQQTFISVDEEGTEAAAATAIIGGATGGPPNFVELTVDRPFVFLIRDDRTGAVLFMGRVLDPAAS